MSMNSTNCYCCSSTSQIENDKQIDLNTDIDRALNELGMLSTITESRQEYLRERAITRRDRNNSEPTQPCDIMPSTSLSGMSAMYNTPSTPLNSPTRSSYVPQLNCVISDLRLVTMNPKYVTCVNPMTDNVVDSGGGIPISSDEAEGTVVKRSDTPVPGSRSMSGAAGGLSDSISHDMLTEHSAEARTSRVLRSRVTLRKGRLRMQRPYSMPTTPYHLPVTKSASSPAMIPVTITDMRRRAVCSWPYNQNCIARNRQHCAATIHISPPPHAPAPPRAVLHRSKSLDEMDFARLCVIEKRKTSDSSVASKTSSNCYSTPSSINISNAYKEVDAMSKQLRDMHV